MKIFFFSILTFLLWDSINIDFFVLEFSIFSTYLPTFDGESGSSAMSSVECKDHRYPIDGPKFYVCDYMVGNSEVN